MVYYKVVWLIFVILQQFMIVSTGNNDDDPESLWSSEEGNSQNTHRIVPSMAIGGSSGRRSGDRHPLVNFFFNFFSVETKKEEFWRLEYALKTGF
jgi:hypothetical protein